MKREIHEEILLYLFELRDSEDHHDLLIKFKNISETLLHERVQELEAKKLITTQYPFTGFFMAGSGESTNFGETESYIKAKITSVKLSII